MPDCKHCLCGLVICACPPPPPEIYDSPLKPRYRSPIDCLGYPYKCCCCIPLKAGVAIICFLSFIEIDTVVCYAIRVQMWALVELSRSERTMATIFPDKDNLFKCAKMIHIFVITAYLVSCGVLMLGIIANKFKAINVYVWVALIFNCICIAVVLISLASQVTRTKMTKRIAMLLTMAVLWHSLFFYYISVVNSYKYRVYGDTVFH